MEQANIDAYLVPSSDPHISEYMPEHYKCIQFASGFTGSAGTLVITKQFAGLWTDFRYFEQAGQQLSGSGFELVKLKVQHTPEFIEWLYEELPPGSAVAFDEKLLSAQVGRAIRADLSAKGIQVLPADLLSPLWTNRPPLPEGPAFLLSEEDSGRSVREKINDVRRELVKQKSEYLLLSALDELAWLFNIRGQDVPYNPVTLAFGLIGLSSATLFIQSNKLKQTEVLALRSEGVELQDYDKLENALFHIPPGHSLFLDPLKNSYRLFRLVENRLSLREGISPVSHLRSVKNQTEVRNMKLAMIKDGVAITRFCKWLQENIGVLPITELSAADKLRTLRAEQDGFAGESFATIGGYNAHAALPHYTPAPHTDAELKPEGLFLVDSGGQYHYGTTDITRMIPLGPVSAEARRDYTLVLMALIEGSSARFPAGTCGYQVDALCRKPLWEAGINYGHGTGHGVGYYLNVHEGPQNIGPSNAPVPLRTGMITSIEPGIYRPGKHGVRIENLTLVVHAETTEFADFLTFETLTLAHIETSLLDPDLLEQKHIEWLNDYHRKVFLALSPLLSAAETEWLREKTAAIRPA